ncbi:hypothetical protein [Oceanithermus sp.]
MTGVALKNEDAHEEERRKQIERQGEAPADFESAVGRVPPARKGG